MIILLNIVRLYRANVRSGDTDLLKFMSNIELNVWDKVMLFFCRCGGRRMSAVRFSSGGMR